MPISHLPLQNIGHCKNILPLHQHQIDQLHLAIKIINLSIKFVIQLRRRVKHKGNNQ